MNKKSVKVNISRERNSFSWYLNDYGCEELEKESILKYYNKNNDIIRNNIKNQINDIDIEILALIEKRALLDKEIEYMENAEKIKNKNVKIEEYINKLKQDGKLNTFVDFEDYHRICSVIENGTYRFSVWYSDRAEKSWRKDQEIFEAGYIFSFNNATLRGDTIANAKSKFDTQEEAIKYIEGRKKAFEKYFKEEKPSIPYKDKCIVSMFNIVLDGYTIEAK